jgi:hypothetical protein
VHKLAILYLGAFALPIGLIGCDGATSPVSPNQVVGAQQSDAAIRSSEDAVMRPLSETSSGMLRPVGACSAGVVAFEAEGRGRASHLGGFDIELSWCLDSTTGEISEGNATVEAANGDRVVMTLAGQAVSASRLHFQAEIVGGSGRFAGAAGMLDLVAVLGESGSWTSEGTGWISY